MLDKLLKKIGLVRYKKYDDLELRLSLTQGALKGALNDAKRAKDRVREFESKIERGDAEAKARWTSPDGKRVLKDLQRALNYLRDYQRAMWVVLAPDNNYYLVKELLEAWGMKPHSEVTDTYARANKGIPKVDRTGQEYDSYGVRFIHDDVERTYADIDPDDPNWRTDVTIRPQKLLESGDE